MKASEHKDTGEKSNVYEAGYHLLPALSDENISEEVRSLKAMLDGVQAVIVSEGYPESLDLEYTISKKVQGKRMDANQAFFGWIKFEAPTTAIKAIDSYLSSRENILRFIIVKTIKENTMLASKLQMAAKKEADDLEASKAGEAAKIETPASPEEIDKSIDALVI